MRNRGRIRAAVASKYTTRLRSLYDEFIVGNWSPLDSMETAYAVSMTSWRPRLPDLPLVLLSLLRQTLRPSLIHVWLAPSDLSLIDPSLVERFSAHGVRFERCDDIGPHKKWLPMLERGGGDPFVICDDDILYPNEWMERLICEDRDDAYVGTRCHRIRRDGDGVPLLYSEWMRDVGWESSPSQDLFITGCGGAIIYPGRILPEFRDREAIFQKCPRADDIWLKAAHAAAGIPCYKTRYSFPCLEIPGTGSSGLMQTNVDAGGNDSQLTAVRHFLGQQETNSTRITHS